MKYYRIKPPFHVHHERGHLAPGDIVPEDWLPAGQAEDLLAAGTIEEVTEEPSTLAAESIEQPGRSRGKGR